MPASRVEPARGRWRPVRAPGLIRCAFRDPAGVPQSAAVQLECGPRLALSLANPALSGGDPLAAGATGQLGLNPRPLPAGSLPDIGAAEADQPLSTSPPSTTT